MTIEVRALGVLCNLSCKYCYQSPQRQAGNVGKFYDIELIKLAVQEEGDSFTLFGGEPLLLPERDLEELLSWGFQRFGKNKIQTNGTLVCDSHLEMFHKYKAEVGISIDGPGELNNLRWAGSLAATQIATARTEKIIERLCHEGMPPGIIVTLHRINAQSDKLEVMNDWFRHLEEIGIRSVRLHILESESSAIRESYGLSASENVAAFLNFAALEGSLTSLKFDVFREIQRLLLGDDAGVSCVWAACDPHTTRSVRGIEGHGQRSSCGRTDKDGIDFSKAETSSFARSIALYLTEQQFGGCAGCRFFLMCKGQCPGTAIDGDWRNRSEHCEVWKALFEFVEAELIASGQLPLSVQPIRKEVEEGMIAEWTRGSNPNVKSLLEKNRSQAPPPPTIRSSGWTSIFRSLRKPHG
jgi:uncharacterized protein